jgi:ATP-dependent RNA helicase DDX27
LEALESFRDERVNFLLATDVAARGLDIHGVESVINYEMPGEYKQYLHRVGRTARAGMSGRCVVDKSNVTAMNFDLTKLLFSSTDP